MYLGTKDVKLFYQASIKYKVVRTNKGRTNKGQIALFRKIKCGLIRDKYLEKFSTKQNIADFLFRLAILEKRSVYLLKRTFSGHEKPEVNR